MTIVQVSPDIDNSGPETSADNKEDIESYEHVSDKSPKMRSTAVNKSTLEKSLSKELTSLNRSKTFESSGSKQYNSSRVKSSRSLFSTSGSDVFKIDDHVERLSTQIQKNFRSNSKTSNAWHARRSPLKRFFMCSCIRAPSVFSSDEINLYAKVGDLLIFREGTTFEQKYLSPEVLRGIKSSLDGKYIPKTRNIKLWNHIGIVVHVCDDLIGEYVKYVLYADDLGLRLRKLSEVTNSCILAHDLCSLRPVHVKNTKQLQQYAALVDDLETVALLALNGKLTWSSFHQAERAKSAASTAAEQDPLLQVLLHNPILSRFYELFVKRMHIFSFSPSQEGIQEATRLFYSMMAVHREKELLEGGGVGSAVSSLKKIASFGKADGDRHTLPLAMIFKSLSVMNEDEGDSKQGDTEFSSRLKWMLVSMDDNKDGMVSLNEFIEAFLSIPCDIIPVDFDLPAVAMGEMVACMFVALGLFQESVLDDVTSFFHPQSFSSSSHGETSFATKEHDQSKKATAVAGITKSMLKDPTQTKLKRDIVLRTR